jgi:hypothetical protein
VPRGRVKLLDRSQCNVCRGEERKSKHSKARWDDEEFGRYGRAIVDCGVRGLRMRAVAEAQSRFGGRLAG